MESSNQLKNLLHNNVPRFIEHIKARGGVTTDEWRWLHCTDESPYYPEYILARADEYLLYPKDDYHFLDGLFVLVLAMAIMSFVPGGVRLFGLHFDMRIENFVEVDGSGET
ncbi:hypothetical protein [Nostoc sp.]|uniref:hypothetical protein n=1 Tax=Nostoc sp. TaxID=1180 RepID=UPI0035935EC4